MLLAPMQRFWTSALGAAQYQAQQAHRQVRPEPSCPLCAQINGPRAHGYYARWIVDWMGTVLRIWIRRFRCRTCARTVSYLPAFAQPYRLLCNALMAAFMTGEREAPGVLRWWDRLRTYARRFEQWLPTLTREVGCALGRPPPDETPLAAWRRLIQKGGGDLTAATVKLVTTWKLTFFRRYQCHQHAV